MTEENCERHNKCECLCQSELFKKFLIVMVGTFLGVFFALSLFAYLHKPQAPCPCMMHGWGMRPPMEYQMYHHHYYGPQGNWMQHKHMPMPVKGEKPQPKMHK